MTELKHGELNVQTEKGKNEIILTWLGAIHEANPEEFLDPFLEAIVSTAAKESLKVTCDFIKLDYMNSSSIPPLIGLLRSLNEQGIEGELIYDKERKVQVASFRALDVIAKKSKYVTISGK